jgi:hypothetical protein
MPLSTPDRYLVQADFEAALDTPFTLRVDADTDIVLTLVEVRPQPVLQPEWESFSLFFEAPAGVAFAHDTFTVAHASLGEFLLFVGAVQDITGTIVFESVFNHPRRDPRVGPT